jgi:hypothetical protein
MRLLLVALLSTASLPVAAVGYPSIDGITRDGYTIAINFDVTPPRVEMWIETPDQALRERSVRAFIDEPCTFTESTNRQGQSVRSFRCAASAKSPLAGTKYRAIQVNGDCEKGDPDYRYVCVSGCDRNKRAPRSMTQQHWEC